MFIVLNLVDFIVIFLLFPETKGKSLEDMAIVFGDQVDAGAVLDEHGEKHGDQKYETPVAHVH